MDLPGTRVFARSPLISAVVPGLVLAAFAVLSCRIALAFVLIPPWQQPDEPAHVVWAEVYRARLADRVSTEPGRERDILGSMLKYGWWRHYGVPSPVPLPPRFYELPFASGLPSIGILVTGRESLGPYYSTAGAVLAAAGRASTTQDLYVLRALSAVLAMATFWVAWLAAREVFDEIGSGVVVALIALHPQFLVPATTASPDALINLLGAIVWWQGVRAIRLRRIAALFLVGATAACAAATDRMGVPLLGGAAIISLAALARHRRNQLLPLFGVVAAGGVMAALMSARWAGLLETSWGEGLLPVAAAQSGAFFLSFSGMLFDTWWFAIGWVRYFPPAAWFAIAAVVSAVAAAGVCARMAAHDADIRIWLWPAVAVVGVQVLAIYWTFFRAAVAPQGRYLFPTIVPVLMLLWTGVETWIPVRYRRQAAIGLILLFALLDGTAWLLVGVPAFAF